MAFKKISSPGQAAESPDKLFFDLPRRKIPGVLAHQAKAMQSYHAQALDAKDVALQLPTGSGKTLVGLLIAEWLRRKNGERVVYLAPTIQLVNQVAEQAESKYGLSVVGLTGRITNYSPTGRTDYRQAEKIAISTYSSLFNTNPFFSDADVLIFDDAHASENYVSKMWSVSIQRSDNTQFPLFRTIAGILRPHIDAVCFSRIESEPDILSAGWVEKLSTPALHTISGELIGAIDAAAASAKVEYPWSLIRDHLHACHLYFSAEEILIRPLIPPTWTHLPFTNPRQRIYMSATLGEGGDLERLFGRTDVKRLPISADWEKQGVGRRLFLFPGMGLDEKNSLNFRHQTMKKAGRSIVLVPNKAHGDNVRSQVEQAISFETLSASDIEDSKTQFTSKKHAVAVIANRYDGIDFPGDDCRVLFVEGLPRATNLQEKFLMSRMSAGLLLNERIQTRVLQAVGRCTRSLEDYSAVVVLGDDLQDYLTDPKRIRFLHPEIQAEIKFGAQQSRNTGLAEFGQFIDTFLRYDAEWEAANQDILSIRENCTREKFPALLELESCVKHEIKYQKSLWQGDYLDAMEFASSTLGSLDGEDLRGYRALWNYLSGSAALLASFEGRPALAKRAETYFRSAKNAAIGVRWLVSLANRRNALDGLREPHTSELSLEQVENIERVIERLGVSHDRKFSAQQQAIISGLSDRDTFEESHRLLGEMVGFVSRNVETDGSPDPWWSLSEFCIVFEDHAGAFETSTLGVDKARQAAGHPKWIRENVPGMDKAEILPVLVTPVKKATPGAFPHLRDVYIWPIDEFREWAVNALDAIRSIRRTFTEPGDLVWRSDALDQLRSAGIDAQSIGSHIKKRIAADHMSR